MSKDLKGVRREPHPFLDFLRKEIANNAQAPRRMSSSVSFEADRSETAALQKNQQGDSCRS